MNENGSPLSPGTSFTVDLKGIRAAKAHFGYKFGKRGYKATVALELMTFLLAVALLITGTSNNGAFFLLAVSICCFMLSQWYKLELKPLPARDHTLTGRLSGEILGRLSASHPNNKQAAQDMLTPRYVWDALSTHWHSFFVMNHILLKSASLQPGISEQSGDMAAVWQTAMQLADQSNRSIIEPGHVIIATMLMSPGLKPVFAHIKISETDIHAMNDWLNRLLASDDMDPPYFGGIGRDWANGFTPMLNKFASNISIAIEHSGARFETMTDSPGVAAVQNSFAQGAHAVAMIGPEGIGKTSYVYALAQLLLEGKVVPALRYNQIFALNPAVLLSNVRQKGELEQIVLSLLSESVQAGHIILFLDDAQLFFSDGTGSIDLSQILLPIIQSGQVRLLMAINPSDYQRLKTHNAALANHISPVMLSERPQAEIMDILEDTTANLENQHNVIIAYEAIREAYRLSGRYDTENAYPGKAIALLEQSLSHAEHGVITELSVQKAIEQTRGVKAASAAPVEVDQLMHLEDLIHQRMINQTRAVKVVASALRRARAGVANPSRPIGSFLFLGPTGVGKTELAKSIAATYFHDEANMIRLDMSEYQQPDDVQRLLSNGQEDADSLIMAVRRQPFSVVLLDEIEKAHPNILNLLLQMLDEGSLTDGAGRQASFKDCVIICTSNAGADIIRQRIEHGEELETFEKEFTDQLINSGQFKPELLNRFDEIVLFRPLKPEELAQVVRLMINGINKTLATQNISVELTDAAIQKIVEVGNDPRLGARPMRRALQRAVEDGIANRILTGQVQPGAHVMLDVQDLAL
jgi:ATP-dependent Clp protease ATP-binding subunit ClpC